MEYDFILRLFVAIVLGGAIGLQREYRAKEAGFRTHFLVSLGSCLFMILSQYGFDAVVDSTTSFDPSRIASQVVTGIGFIGAGTIIFQKHVVRGLTTAAGIWTTAAIGMACGAAMYALAIATTVLVLVCLELLHYLVNRFGTRNTLLIFYSSDEKNLYEALNRLSSEGCSYSSYNMHEEAFNGERNYEVSVELKMKRKDYYNHRLIDIFSQIPEVHIKSIE